jgi:peroxiredoxin Q/BCP
MNVLRPARRSGPTRGTGEISSDLRILSRLWVALLAMAAFSAAHGATMAPRGGSEAPGFALKSIAGDSVRLNTLTAEGPVVLVVLRGFPGYQCPLCTRQVNEFAGRAKDFAAKGARVVMVYPGPAEKLQAKANEFLANKDWPADFVFLLDPDYTFTKAYGLRWDAPKETAYPATFIIQRDGKVTYAKVSQTHGGRTTAQEVLSKL